MNRHEAQSGKRRKFVRFVEVLDDRLVFERPGRRHAGGGCQSVWRGTAREI